MCDFLLVEPSRCAAASSRVLSTRVWQRATAIREVASCGRLQLLKPLEGGLYFYIFFLKPLEGGLYSYIFFLESLEGGLYFISFKSLVFCETLKD